MVDVSPKFLAWGHGLMFTFHVLAGLKLATIDFSPLLQDEFLSVMQHCPYAFLTGWNIVGQCIYLLLSLTIDIQDITRTEFRSISRNSLRYFQGYLFHAIIVPYTCFVVYMFWSLYVYDVDLVMPAQVLKLLPPILNHCLHTFVLVPVFFELIFNRIYIPNHKIALLGYTIYQVAYWGVILFVLFYHGKWVYRIFAQLPFTTRILYAICNYIVGILFYFVFYNIQKFRWLGYAPKLMTNGVLATGMLSNGHFSGKVNGFVNGGLPSESKKAL